MPTTSWTNVRRCAERWASCGSTRSTSSALWAYSAWFASTRDTYAFETKHQCFDETRAGVPSIEATRARTAKDRIVSAMLTAIPVPEGTMDQGMALGSADRDAETPALAGGVCAILQARGHATTRARCEEIASSAASYAMARWIGATSDPIGN